MPVTIEPGVGVDAVRFGLDRSAAKAVAGDGVLFVEYRDGLVAAVSFRNQPEFTVGGRRVSVDEVDEWLRSEDPYVDGESYIFPELAIAAFGLGDPSAGYEITAYSEALRPSYERNLDKTLRYSELRAARPPEGTASIVPYTSVGGLVFGSSTDAAIQEFGKPTGQGGNRAGKEVLHWKGMMLRFQDDRLVQVTYSGRKRVLLEGEDIGAAGPGAEVFDRMTPFVRGAYTVYFDVGIAFAGFDIPKEQNTIYVFSDAMKEFWLNTKRPLL